MTNIILNAKAKNISESKDKQKVLKQVCDHESAPVCIECGGAVAYLYNKYCRDFSTEDLKIDENGKLLNSPRICNIRGCSNWRCSYFVRIEGTIYKFAMCSKHVARICWRKDWEGQKVALFSYGERIEFSGDCGWLV
jgi:hypothetical protein